MTSLEKLTLISSMTWFSIYITAKLEGNELTPIFFMAAVIFGIFFILEKGKKS